MKRRGSKTDNNGARPDSCLELSSAQLTRVIGNDQGTEPRGYKLQAWRIDITHQMASC